MQSPLEVQGGDPHKHEVAEGGVLGVLSPPTKPIFTLKMLDRKDLVLLYKYVSGECKLCAQLGDLTALFHYING